MEKVTKSDAEWKAQLDPQQYDVLRNHGTERPFTGKYLDSHEDGVYRCAACGNPLFSSDTKFNSHSGWPSFADVISEGNVELKTDRSFLMSRTEVNCNACGGHLGHVFDDGPGPKGLRYCINSAALELDGKSDSEKADKTDN